MLELICNLRIFFYFSILSYSFLILSETKLDSVIEGTASVISLKEPNKLSLKLTNTPTGKYDVWTTDYDNYSLVYSCSQIIPLVLKLEQM